MATNTIQKFIDFLNYREKALKIETITFCRTNKYDDTYINKQSEKMAECRSLTRQLSVPIEEWPNHGELFIDFDIVSDLLAKAHFTARESMEIIFTFLEKNIASGITNVEASGFDAKKINEYHFKTISPKEVEDMIRADTYRVFMNRKDEELTEKEKAQKQELEEFTKAFPLDLEEYASIHKILEEHYFNKKDSYTKEDIEAFIFSLKDMKVDPKLCDAISIILLKPLTKKAKKLVEPPKFIKKEESPVANALNKKEYNLLYHELKKYYNPDIKKTNGYLKIEEIIYCIYLLKKMNFQEESIKQFLTIALKENKKYQLNPIALYIELYNKLNYYAKKVNIEESLLTINSILKEMMITDDISYGEWKSLLEEELNTCLSKLPNTYEYELKEAEALRKKC